MKVIHTADPKMISILKSAETIASSKASVMIYGESGTGKELLARYIHSKSVRSAKAFCALNCAAVPEGLLESELFGYEKGAFTGADQRRAGKFEIADKSTFLLDEVSEMPILLQAKLLRVIQEGEVQRLGAASPTKVDVRLICTANRSLEDMTRNGQFREDLYYRLNVIPLRIPSLRERPKDIEMLTRLFLEVSCAENNIEPKSLSEDAFSKIMGWKWPGNIRELQNVVERSVLMSSSKQLKATEILINNYQENADGGVLKAGMTVSEMERNLILKTLEYTDQNRTQAAQLLGISIRTLRNKINEYKKESYL